MKVYARFDEILCVFLLNGLSILDVEFANLVPLWRHLYGLITHLFNFRFSKGI